MGPGVGSDLVTVGSHPLDGSYVAGSYIDLPLGNVVASDEEGRLCIVGRENVQNVVGIVGDWAVIICNSDCSRGNTFVDSVATIRDRSKLCAGHSARVGSRRCHILRASRAIFVVATRGVAIIRTASAP